MSALHGQEVGASRRAGTAALSSERVRVANAFIEENLARRVTARAMAEAAGLSVWHFSRAYKGATGTTPHKVVLEMRMLRARQLLARSNMRVCAVAREVGVVSPSHFSAIFRRVCGTSPARYRLYVAMRRDEAR